MLLVLLTMAGSEARAADGLLISSLNEMVFNAPKEKGKAELIDGKVGKAIRFSLDKDARTVFFTSNIRGKPEWDKAAGFSFWVKGDGSASFGGLQFIYDNDYGVRYDYAFPINNTEWTKIVVAWGDLIPVMPGAKAKPLAGPDGNLPSKLSSLWIGKWWYWGDYPACSFAIDELRLEPVIERDNKDYKPAEAPLQRFQEKLKAGKPVTIITLGDSLTDTHHWANRKIVWPNLLKEQIKTKYKSEMTIVNPAIGGTMLRQGLILLPRALDKAPHPDLVTIFFGGNDWESGMRGEQFHQTCVDAIDRVRWATDGKADVLILTTAPSVNQWKSRTELGDACRKAAQERNAGIADVEQGFHSKGKADPAKLFVDDKTHLSPAGHETVAEVVLKAIENGGK